MKLYNYISSRFAVVLFFLLTIWAAIFYYSMLDEIYDSLDDGLENQKLLVIQQAAKDSTVLQRMEFGDGYYRIQELSRFQATTYRDSYVDTLMYMIYEEDFEPYRMLSSAFKLGRKYYELQVITSMVEEDDLVANLFFYLIFLYFGLMVSIILLNNFVHKRVWRPFYQIIEWLQQFRLDKPIPVKKIETNIREFSLLNERVIKLIERNISVYNEQKQFIENASHELQTPLGISINKLELLVENFEHDPEALKIVASVMDNLQRLTQLNKSLLLLSKISNKQFLEGSEVDFNLLLDDVVEDFSEQANYKDIKISLQKAGRCLKKMDADLARIFISNIVKNAILHNHAGGYVRITVEDQVIIVENSGPSGALSGNQIFERFQKGSASQNTTGLGLAIVKAIAELYAFSVRYSYHDRHVFTIRF